MGVVFGEVEFVGIESPYAYFKTYCQKAQIAFEEDDPDLELIGNLVLPDLKVFNENGVEIDGDGGIYVSGMKGEGYAVNILGIGYPFFEEEFPHHVKAYQER